MDIEHINIDVKPGFYLDRCGEWQKDLRIVAERRSDPFANRKYQERRTTIRREVDRDMIAYLKKSRN